MTEEEKAESGISRRTALKRIGAAGALAWTTPVIASLRTPAFAASPVPHPECVEATCTTFIACASANPDCVCVNTDQGGFCVPGSTSCGVSPNTCPGGTSAECGPGEVCALDTCCVTPVCVPTALTAACPSDARAPVRSASQPRRSGAATIAGW